jgi:hypothetical protein
MKKMILLLLMGFGFTACGSADDATITNLKYDFTYNDCKTGAHSFSSVEEYCKGLQNDELNHGCAYSLREYAFKSRCTGKFTTF